jgi:simple sugar transport system ATP-binding protein
MKERAEEIVDTYDVRPPNIDLPAASLSGGNQQRFIAGRELLRRPSLLLAVHPTRGVDLVATQFLHGRLLEERTRGTAVLLVSADLGELEELSDLVLIFYRGKVRYAARRDQLDAAAMGAALLGLDHPGIGS